MSDQHAASPSEKVRTDWKQFAHSNLQGAVLWYLRDNPNPGGICGLGETVYEIARQLGVSVGRVRVQLSTWKSVRNVETCGMTCTGAQRWRAVKNPGESR